MIVEKDKGSLADLPALLSVAEYARVTGVDESTVRRLCNRGEIPAKKVGQNWVIGRDLAFGELIPDALVMDERAVSRVLDAVCDAVRDGRRLVIEMSPGTSAA